jgi:hypothetical protein
MEKSKKTGRHQPQHYSELRERIRKNPPPTAADTPLPGEVEAEQEYDIKPPKYTEKANSEESPVNEQIPVNFRMSKKRKEILERWLKQERDQNLSAGLRAIIDEYMHRHNII